LRAEYTSPHRGDWVVGYFLHDPPYNRRHNKRHPRLAKKGGRYSFAGTPPARKTIPPSPPLNLPSRSCAPSQSAPDRSLIMTETPENDEIAPGRTRSNTARPLCAVEY